MLFGNSFAQELAQHDSFVNTVAHDVVFNGQYCNLEHAEPTVCLECAVACTMALYATYFGQ